MKRRNFIRLSAGVPLIIGTPVLAGNGISNSDSFSGSDGGSEIQSYLKVKTGSKINYPWCLRKVTDIHSLVDYTPENKIIKLSQYGGDIRRNVGGTGFFRVQSLNGRWFLIDPTGHPYISAGFNSVKVKGNNEEYIIHTLRDTGTSTIGCWSDYEKLRKVQEPLSYSVSLGFINGFMQSQPKKENHGNGWKRRYPNLTISVFHPDFENFADKYAREKIGILKDDPYCIGYFSDNELPFLFDALDRYLELPEDDYGHLAAKQWLEENGIAHRNMISHNDRMKFLGYMADRYYSVCNRYIKKYDPNHLYLGSRLHGYDNSLLRSTTSMPVFKSAGKYADIISINLYGTIGLNPAELNRFSDWAGKPIYITEFYAKGMDSGLDNNEGAGHIVPTQEDRGIFYQNFTLLLLQSKSCVGWDWHRFIDPESSNKGLVDKDYKVYRQFQSKVKELNEQKYSLADFFQAKHPVKIVMRNEEYLLFRNGAPLKIKGHIGLKNPDFLIDIHGNSVKIYSDYTYDLDYLAQKNLAVLFTVDLKKFTEAALNKDLENIQAEKNRILNLIQELKAHPSIMMWCLGDNEIFRLTGSDLKPYLEALNQLMKEVKKLDPEHPVITAIHQMSLDYLTDISKTVPEAEAVGINISDMQMLEELPKKLSEINWTGAFIVTDFHYDNNSDIRNAPFDIPSRTEGKSSSFPEEAYIKTILNHSHCLGAFMLT